MQSCRPPPRNRTVATSGLLPNFRRIQIPWTRPRKNRFPRATRRHGFPNRNQEKRKRQVPNEKSRCDAAHRRMIAGKRAHRKAAQQAQPVPRWRMRSTARLAALLAFLCGITAAKIAAADFAECAGVIVDENGVPIPAAKIALARSSGQTLRAETDGAGRFLLRNLLSGDYKVEARKEGFFVLAGQTVMLRSGSNDVTLTLKHAEEMHAQVQVTAAANQIDTQDTAQREIITAREIRDIPVPNSHILQQSLAAMPQVVQDNFGGLHVAGARSGETQYLLDGFEIGDPVNNTLSARFNVDATRAAEVQTGRIGAGYEHSGASVLNLETPEGDDKWRFGTTNPIPGINIQNGVRLGNWYPRFTFSGPIERGRFWFSDAISLQHTFTLVRELPDDANTSRQWAGDNLVRLQYNFSPKHILHGSFLYNLMQDESLGLDPLNPESPTLDLHQ